MNGTKLPRPQPGQPPMTGILTGVAYAPTSKPNYSDEIRVSGQWEAAGNGYFYLPLGALEAFTDAGLVRQEPGTDQYQNPLFSVTMPSQRVMIWREEVPNSRAKPIRVKAIDLNGNDVPLPASPKPVIQEQPVASAAAPAPVAPPVATRAPNAVPPVAAPANGYGKTSKDRWNELDARYGACLAIAAYRLPQALDRELSELDPAVIEAGGRTVLDLTERMGLESIDGLAATLRARCSSNGKQPSTREHRSDPVGAPASIKTPYDDFPEELDDDGDLPF